MTLVQAVLRNASTFYRDADGDGFDTSDLIAIDCEQPDGFVGNNQDCDDGNQSINPSANEICDNLDNDCNEATVEQCSGQCTASGAYLFCAEPANHSTAADICAGQNTQLVRIQESEARYGGSTDGRSYCQPRLRPW